MAFGWPVTWRSVLARVVVVVALGAMALVGCGGAARPVTPSPGVAVDLALTPALAGEQPRAAPDPQSLARQIAVAEHTAREPAGPPELVAAAGWTAQVAYRALVEHPEWDTAVLAEIPAPLQDAVRRNVAAGRELRAMAPPAPPRTVPAWRIVAPLGAP